MPGNSILPDNYSNDDGVDNNKQQDDGQVFAHPMVGKRRRSTIGLPKQAQ